MLYDLLRPLLFTLPAERAHTLSTRALTMALATAPARAAARRLLEVRDPALRVTRWGIDFPAPLGLAAGFDKAGTYCNALGAVGFGFVEIGTVTALGQPGNPCPRLFRLPQDRALLNRLGFNNPGAAAVASRLSRTAAEPILGINLGKSRATELDEAPADYLRSLELLEPFASYVAVNVSSPNTPGLRTLQEAAPLRELLRALRQRGDELAAVRGGTARPLLLKIAPDLSDSQLVEAVGIAAEEGVVGVIATNTTVSRHGLRTEAARVEAMGAGGISGAPLASRALEVTALIYRETGGRMPIIGVGGIGSVDDAWQRIRAGASLLQLYTGFVYGGPAIISRIHRGILDHLRREGMRTLDEAVGSGVR